MLKLKLFFFIYLCISSSIGLSVSWLHITLRLRNEFDWTWYVMSFILHVGIPNPEIQYVWFPTVGSVKNLSYCYYFL